MADLIETKALLLALDGDDEALETYLDSFTTEELRRLQVATENLSEWCHEVIRERAPLRRLTTEKGSSK